MEEGEAEVEEDEDKKIILNMLFSRYALTTHPLQWVEPQSLPCTLPLKLTQLTCHLPILLTLSSPPPVTGPASPAKADTDDD